MITLKDAIAARDAIVEEFDVLCEEARQSPVSIAQFGRNRAAYDKACDDVYRAMLYGIADTGVQILRDGAGVKDIVAKYNPNTNKDE